MCTVRRLLFLVLVSCGADASAASPEAYQRLDGASAAACAKAAGLKQGSVGRTIRFSDDAGMDARIVRGRWPQPHMRNAAAQLLCLYDRRTGRAEVQEMPAR